MPDYIPVRDADYADWMANFRNQLDTDTAGGSAAYLGVSDAQYIVIDAAASAFADAYEAATEPATRTPVTVAAKNTAKANLTPIIRAASMTLTNNENATDEIRARYGLTVPKGTRTPVPPPTSHPLMEVRKLNVGVATVAYSDSDNPEGKNKPAGAVGVEVFCGFSDDGSAVEIEDSMYSLTATKAPFALPVDPANRGKTMTLRGRYVTRSGPGGVAQVGPWSAPLIFTAT